MIMPRLSLIAFICNDANNAIIQQPAAFIINMKRRSCIFFVEYTPALPVYRFNLYNTTQVNPNANKEAPAIPPTDRYTKPASPMKMPAKIDLIIKSLFM